ncbi:PE family protein PE19, partial [Mycobacterium tuberculosis MD13744]
MSFVTTQPEALAAAAA